MVKTMEPPTHEFRPWSPGDGRVFDKLMAVAVRVAGHDPDRPWVTPRFVLAAAYDGRRGVFVERGALARFLTAHADTRVVLFDAALALAALHPLLVPVVDVYGLVDRDRVIDLRLLHRSLVLGLGGDPAAGPARPTLEQYGRHYLGPPTPDAWASPGHAGPAPTEHGRLAGEAVLTWRVHAALAHQLNHLLANTRDAVGLVGPRWLDEQARWWGPQGHFTLVRADVALRAAAANGLRLAPGRHATLLEEADARAYKLGRRLADLGGVPGAVNKFSAVHGSLDYWASLGGWARFPRTADGLLATGYEDLRELDGRHPGVTALQDVRRAGALLQALREAGGDHLRPAVDPLAPAGRDGALADALEALAAGSGQPPAVVPPPGSVFLIVTCRRLGQAALAQVCRAQFGRPPGPGGLAALLAAGGDPLAVVAARLAGGPSGPPTRRGLVNWEDPAVAAAWAECFPETRDFLGGADLDLATLLGLTPAGHAEHTGDRRFLDAEEYQGRADRPAAALGVLCDQALTRAKPYETPKRSYRPRDLRYFLSNLADRAGLLPPELRPVVRRRPPHRQLRDQVRQLAEAVPVISLTGRLHGGGGRGARRRALLAGPAADATWRGLWHVWRRGYRVVHVAAARLVVEVRAGEDLGGHAAAVRDLMSAGIREVLTDVPVPVRVAAAAAYYRDAEEVRDGSGRLLLWHPG